MKRFRAIAAAAVVTATLATGVSIAAAQMASTPSPGQMTGQMTGQMNGQMTGQTHGQMNGQMNGLDRTQMEARRDQMRSTMTADQQAQCDQNHAAMVAPATANTADQSTTSTTIG